jgi:dCTP deaminase
MLLSDIDINKLMDSGDIVITPFNDSLLRPSSYCLTLGNLIHSFQDTSKVISPVRASTYPDYIEHEISPSRPYILKPGELVLAQTQESLSLPVNLTGFLSNISGLARLGINTLLSTHVAPGFGLNHKKPIVLEIINHSKFNIELTSGMRICHMLFARNSSETSIGYDDKFPGRYTKGMSSEYYNDD